MNTSKNCQQAWKAVDGFVDRCKEQYPQSIIAVIITGSLARGAYQPGLSDVDLVTILDDNSPESMEKGILSLYRKTSRDYGVPLDPIIFKHGDLCPPWSHDLRIQPELLRLKTDGRVLYGENVIQHLPMPTKRQMWQFHRWSREQPLESAPSDWRHGTLKGSINTVLEQAMTYFYYKTGIAEYSKHHIADLFSNHFPHFQYISALRLASHLWRHYPDSADEGLRVQMAKDARDIQNHVTRALGFGDKCLVQ